MSSLESRHQLDLPDIVTDLLSRKDFGVGEYVGIDQIDLVSMKLLVSSATQTTSPGMASSLTG